MREVRPEKKVLFLKVPCLSCTPRRANESHQEVPCSQLGPVPVPCALSTYQLARKMQINLHCRVLMVTPRHGVLIVTCQVVLVEPSTGTSY